jgi:hypothetical protein
MSLIVNSSTVRALAFSEPFIDARVVERGIYSVDKETVVVNCSNARLEVGATSIGPWRGTVLFKGTFEAVAPVVCVSLEDTLLPVSSYRRRDELMSKWAHVADLFPLPHLQSTALWRSVKDSVVGVNVNLWFASSGTDCGIHNRHSFIEVHTQIMGIGRMQKFAANDQSTLFEDIYMAPGTTHEPFCGKDYLYPWHQYYADTDCIWLAVEYQ